MENLSLPFVECKVCNDCNRNLPATTKFFYVNQAARDGITSTCKKCRNRRAVRRVQGNPLPPQKNQRTCKECGVKFRVAGTSRQQYCTKECARLRLLERRVSHTKECIQCGLTFCITGTTPRKKKFCSRECGQASRRFLGLSGQVCELLGEGLSTPEVAFQLNVTVERVRHIEHRILWRRGAGMSEGAIRYQWKKGKACLICGFDRYIEAAHIIPARQGGTTSEDNLMPLCPTHHRLFDCRRLLPEEAQRISHLVPNFLDFIAKETNVRTSSDSATATA